MTYVRDHVVHTKYLGEEGTQAALDKDRRPVMAALGFMGGGGLADRADAADRAVRQPLPLQRRDQHRDARA